MSLSSEQLPQIRFDITEAARILRVSRATLYERIRAGEIKAQKDGRRSYVTVRGGLDFSDRGINGFLTGA
jgi:excisionase family DNA binding protein